MKNVHYTSYQFALFRILFGLYLVVHFSMLIPYGPELFSNQGMLPSAQLNFTYGVFPNILYFIDGPLFTQFFLMLLTTAALFFAVGIKRRILSLVLWYGWAALYNRNNLIGNPGMPFVGWLLLACAVIPPGESWSLENANADESWELPPLIFYGAWWLMALGYTLSGLHKLTSPSWRDGTALLHVFQNPLARDYFLREWILALPIFMHKLLTWGSLLLELLFAPLALFQRTRMLVWIGIVGMHIGILTMINFADLTLGVLTIHLFTLDPRWFMKTNKLSATERPIVFFDGVCGLCNHFIQFIFNIDKNEIFCVAALQGQTATQKLSERDRLELKSIVLLDSQGNVYRSSDAVLKIISQLGGIWWILSLLYYIPRFIREPIYFLIARYRYVLFGKKDTCRLPTASERSRFLL